MSEVIEKVEFIQCSGAKTVTCFPCNEAGVSSAGVRLYKVPNKEGGGLEDYYFTCERPECIAIAESLVRQEPKPVYDPVREGLVEALKAILNYEGQFSNMSWKEVVEQARAALAAAERGK